MALGVDGLRNVIQRLAYIVGAMIVYQTLAGVFVAPYQIEASDRLTGGIAHLGKDNENGARLAIDEANAAGVTIIVEARSDGLLEMVYYLVPE